ncbi:MAG: AraC family transcriptional regulator [Dysgonamonadaceae bacterium]
MQQRTTTTDEYRKQMNVITEYINNHLDESLDLPRMAEVCHFSPYHFHRITRAFLGEPIGSYIIRIRLETAAKLLRHSDIPVSEIAGKVGYDAPASLSKAFKLQYGFSPTEYRTNKEIIIIKPEKKNMKLKIKGPKVVDIPAKQVIYISQTGEYGNLDFGGSWQRLWQFIKEHKLFSAGIEHIAIYHDDPKITESEKLRTEICLAVKKETKPQGDIGIKEIKEGRFALFLYQGTYEHLGAVYDTIYGKLLPENNLRLRDYPCFEKYLNHPGRTEPEKLKTEIYVPIE